MGEFPSYTILVIKHCNNSPGSPLWQEHRDVCENVLPVVHPCSLLMT